MEGGRWVLGEAGKDLLDDFQVECLHLGPILVDGEGGKVNQMTIQSYPKVLSHAGVSFISTALRCSNSQVVQGSSPVQSRPVLLLGLSV